MASTFKNKARRQRQLPPSQSPETRVPSVGRPTSIGMHGARTLRRIASGVKRSLPFKRYVPWFLLQRRPATTGSSVRASATTALASRSSARTVDVSVS